MLPKPPHLGRKYAEQFQDASVVAAYPLRPPYPDGLFPLLAGLVDAECGDVLDVGCGTGEIARRLAPLVAHVDAVDFAQAMIETGQKRPDGALPNLRWICGAVEEVSLFPPYGLVTAAASLHWMDWQVVLPRFRQVLTSNGTLAIIEEEVALTPNPEAFWSLVRRCSTNQEYQPYNLVEELERRGLFRRQGEQFTETIVFSQAIEDYIEACHARNGFSRNRMTPEDAKTFDTEARQALLKAFPEGDVRQSVRVRVTWGAPCLE